MNLLKDLLLKHDKSANLLNDTEGCNAPKRVVDLHDLPEREAEIKLGIVTQSAL
jgi:hypothetical protein